MAMGTDDDVHLTPRKGADLVMPEGVTPITTRPAATLDPARRDTVMRWSLILLWLFNLEDFVLTQAALRSGASESNLLFGYFLDMGLVPALVFKLGIVTVGSWLLWRYRGHPATLVASLGLALAYFLVTVFHLIAGVA